MLAGTLDVNATMASNRVNTVARNLAAYAAIFAVVTMISGIYGMNFQHMPELGWRFGYGWALGLMAVGAGGLYIYFKRKGSAKMNTGTDDTLALVAARVAERFPADLERIHDYVRMPSVITRRRDRSHGRGHRGLDQGAGGSFELVATPGHPLVLGELPGPAAPPGCCATGCATCSPPRRRSGPRRRSRPRCATCPGSAGGGGQGQRQLQAAWPASSWPSRSCGAGRHAADRRPDDRGRGGAGQPQPGRRGQGQGRRPDRRGRLRPRSDRRAGRPAGAILGCKGLCDLELWPRPATGAGPPSTCTPASRPGSPRRCGPWSRPWPP